MKLIGHFKILIQNILLQDRQSLNCLKPKKKRIYKSQETKVFSHQIVSGFLSKDLTGQGSMGMIQAKW